MGQQTRILIAEDFEADFELARRELRKLVPHCDFERVETREAFLAALAGFQPDLVISDFRMPAFDGLTALRLTLEHSPDTPVIIFTSAINEDTAVECMKAGAADYVIKEHLKRLGPAVVRSLEDKREHLRRRTAEAALKESDDRLRQLAENVDSLLFVFDLEADGPRVTYLGPACERIWDRPRAELEQNPCAWTESICAGDRPAVEAALSGLMNGDAEVAETRYRAARRDGSQRSIRLKARVVRSVEGRPVRVVGIAEDITAQTRAEEANALLQAQLMQAQKMESIGRLAGGVAHDFNNLICVILGYAQLAKDALPANDPLLSDLGEIEKASERARDLTRQLLAFSRKQTISPCVLNLNEHVKETRKTLARLIREDIELRFQPGTDLWNIRFDPSQLDQVLVNLAVNARDAMPAGGMLTIETRNLAGCAVDWSAAPGRVPGDYVGITVRDTGTGMDLEVLNHLFEPFFTTKGVGQGTGLGLATVYGILQQNGGYIDVESRPGLGTAFRVMIPRAAEADAPAEAPREASLAHGSGSVLLVEDDPQVRTIAARMLQTMGYNVTAAATPEAAVSFSAAAGSRFDLLLTDLVMPGLSGPELRKRVLAFQPEMRVLYISGYAPDAILGPNGSLEATFCLQKPFDMDTLGRALRQALNQPAACAGTTRP